jgi:hypothetical protein
MLVNYAIVDISVTGTELFVNGEVMFVNGKNILLTYLGEEEIDNFEDLRCMEKAYILNSE